ncbi:uncharacterized protein LOC142889882 [Nelusetta ayraudi]|uniref:uncharacterized protein LOC142889882 n=1 Tax=Nelusetta ayraudi TaxID=303726 RepID=UPI003F70FF0F
MVLRLIRDTRPAGSAAGDSVIDMREDESALILIKHCNDMKQQEARLRLITLLLLLVNMALLLFTNRLHPWHQGNFASAGRGGEVSPSAALLSQEKVCPADPETSDLPVTFQRWRIHLTHEPPSNESDRQYLRWNAGIEHFVIPQSGFYFVYVRTTLRCHNSVNAAEYALFKLELHSWNEGYNETQVLAQAWDSVACAQGSDASTNVFVGQIFDLLEGDHVSVFIKHGYNLVTESFFGAYVT